MLKHLVDDADGECFGRECGQCVNYVYVLCCSILLRMPIENQLLANVGSVFIMCMYCVVASC